jgi:hypothetical protein
MNHTKRHLTMTLVAMVCLIHQTLTAEAPPEETPTDTQSPPANNVSAGNCGIGLKVPDYLCRNVDDNQTHGISGFEEWDIDHNPSLGDDDLRPVTISGSAGEYGATMFLSILDGGEKINGKFWEDAEKKKEQTQLNWYIPPNSMLKVTVYIEGYETSDAVNDVIIEAKVICTTSSGQLSPPKIVHETTTVYEADLDVDSNNNEGLVFENGSPEEDKIEDSTGPSGHWQKRPGKILMVNDGFGDDIPDWADGFNIDPSNADTAICGAPIKFVPMLLARKKPFTNNCKVKFTYSASDPRGVQVVNGLGFPNYDKHFTKPPGHIRIWIKDNDGTTRNPYSVIYRGHFVPTGVEIPWEYLSDGETAKLWIEAVEPSATLGDITVNAEISEDGAKCTDQVCCTAIRITCEPISAEIVTGSLAVHNSAGIVSGEAGVYRIDVAPEQFPDEEITWSTGTGDSNFIKLTKSGTARFVAYRETSGTWGDINITAKVTGNYYNDPRICIKVFEKWSNVQMNIFVAHDASGNPVIRQSLIESSVQKVNNIYQQAGIRFNPVVMPWSSSSGNGENYLNIQSTQQGSLALANCPINEGVRVVFVNQLPLNVEGWHFPNKGIICRTDIFIPNQFAKLVAHELGHACGLDDIYMNKNDPNAGYFNSSYEEIDLRAKALREWSQADWPEQGALNSQPAYYSRFGSGNFPTSIASDSYATRQVDLIPRLLMHGDTSTEDIDIPLGNVYGVIGGYPNLPLKKDHAKVGLNNMTTRSPSHAP